jgi:hypothetical protein
MHTCGVCGCRRRAVVPTTRLVIACSMVVTLTQAQYEGWAQIDQAHI